MGLTKQIKTTLGILASVLVVAMPASAATTIQVVRDVSSRDAALPTGATATIEVVRDVSARDAAILATATPIQVVRDVSARDAAILATATPILVVRDISARDARAASGEAAIAYFKANERSTMAGRSLSPGPTSAQDRAARAGGFDWIDAAVGASSALLLGVLVGMSLLAARHLRSGPLAH
jgi:hypothetical protein